MSCSDDVDADPSHVLCGLRIYGCGIVGVVNLLQIKHDVNNATFILKEQSMMYTPKLDPHACDPTCYL